MLEKLKKNGLSVIAILCAAASLTLSIVHLTQDTGTVNYAQQIEALEEKNAELQFQLDALELQLEEATYIQGLSDWSLDASVWTDGAGADAIFTARPESYREGDTATLMVYLGSEIAANLPCAWNGVAYTATAQLPAANGYSFECILNGEPFLLASPDSPLVPELVYLADSLNSYCTLTIGSWASIDQILDVSGINISIQLPQLVSGGMDLSIDGANLVLYRGDTQTDVQALTLIPGEGSGSFVTDELDLAFQFPALAEGDLVELWLEVTLSGGEVLRASGGSWNYEDGQLQLTAG